MVLVRSYCGTRFCAPVKSLPSGIYGCIELKTCVCVQRVVFYAEIGQKKKRRRHTLAIQNTNQWCVLWRVSYFICSQITTLCLRAAVGQNQSERRCKQKCSSAVDESKFVQCAVFGKDHNGVPLRFCKATFAIISDGLVYIHNEPTATLHPSSEHLRTARSRT